MEKTESTNVTDCVLNIIQNKTENCHTKNMPNQNHLLEISRNHVFWYIITPITLHISCEEEDMIQNLTMPTNIYLSTNCDEVHVISEKPETIRKTVRIKENELSANFSKYDEIYGNWKLNETIKIDTINITSLKERRKNERAFNEQYQNSKTYRFFYDATMVPIEYVADVEDPLTQIFFIIILPITLWICFLRVCCRPCLK